MTNKTPATAADTTSLSLRADGMSVYQQVIHTSRYARWNEEQGRREFWGETVDRYVDFFEDHLGSNFNFHLKPELKAKVSTALMDMEVMPSMRTFMTAGKALQSAHVSNFNCLGGDTKVLTSKGLINISDLSGQEVEVLDGNGEWTSAPFRSFGIQKTRKVTFSKRLARTYSLDVDCTPAHKWVTTKGLKTTDTLRVGDEIQIISPSKAVHNLEEYSRGLVHGLIYGDGTRVTRRYNGKNEANTAIVKLEPGFKIRVCGEHEDIVPIFTSLGYVPRYYPHMGGDPMIELLDGFAKCINLKALPEEDQTFSFDYLRGFLRGWMAADGSVTKASGQVTLCSDQLGLDWLYKWSPVFGLEVSGASKLSSETNFGHRSRDTFNIRFSKHTVSDEDIIIKRKREKLTQSSPETYYVSSISDELTEQEVYCATVPSTESFVINGSLLTGNCSYLVVDSVRSFSEHMYVLMCGSGSGFSVEKRFTNKLPEVPEELHHSDTTIVVSDSRKGWCAAYNQFLNLLYAGNIPKWDVSRLRPEGARLKTFGGYSSGPKVLEDLFEFTIKTFQGAKGRKFRPIEVFSLYCFIAQIVIVGGVRRAATICLFDPDDMEMRRAKTGAWYNKNAHFAMANISAVFETKPQSLEFLDFWRDLIASYSGEPGILNRKALWEDAERIGRKVKEENGNKIPFGVNPCSLPAEQYILTSNGYRQISDLLSSPSQVLVGGKAYEATQFYQTGVKEVHDVRTIEGYTFAGTANHEYQLVDDSWVKLEDLKQGDKIKVHNHRDYKLDPVNQEDYDKGWLLGEVVGDGGHNPTKYHTYTAFWEQDKESLAPAAYNLTREHFSVDSPIPRSGMCPSKDGPYRCFSSGLTSFASEYITPKEKEVLPSLMKQSTSFIRGFIAGYFDADGSVQGDLNKGISVRLGSISYTRLQAVQQMLVQFGVYSTIYKNRADSGMRPLPNGKGGTALYPCKENHELVISRDSVDHFYSFVGFRGHKQKQLQELLSNRYRGAYKSKFYTTVESTALRGIEPVYDARVDTVECFDCNGVYAHNSEISLRPYEFCNLTGVVVRPEDTMDTLLDKIEVATILGTWQATISDFDYLRKIWTDNVREERLLGVCLSGIMDHPILSQITEESAEWFRVLRDYSWKINAEHAELLGIPKSASVTAIKPAGNSSQLYDTASGIHPRYAPYYIRTIRQSNGDPLTAFLKANGIPHEVSVQNPRDTVFSFPMAAPEGAITANQRTAIEQLDHWLHVKKNFTTHTVSCTIYVRENEWVEVGAWVYHNFDEITGLSFLPYDDHTYQQAPYQPITKEEYLEALSKMPAEIDWTLLAHFEKGVDTTSVSQEFACTSGGCELI
jgi:ribonucleotide reductase alpha subunit